jgi:hypothetical protein
MIHEKYTNSSFWLSDDFLSDGVDVLTGVATKDNTTHLIRLAGYRRAIANFVRLVTNKDIPVRFEERGNSYTDGKSVTIAANLNDKDFDSAVGLALHEGSHIKLTSFDTMGDLIRNSNAVIPKHLIDMVQKKYPEFKFDTGDNENTNNYIVAQVKSLLNIIEDRRIDNFIFDSAPGYKGYYHALYNKYFNDKAIDKGLASKEFRQLDWDSYMFRICNITNENRDLNALPGFMDIWNAIDLKNIGRLKHTDECLEIAFKIFEIVESNLPVPDPQQEDDTRDEDTQKITNEQFDEMINNIGDLIEDAKTPAGDVPADDGSKADGEEAKVQTGKCSGDMSSCTPTDDLPELTDAMLKRLEKAIRKQNDFMNGDIKKKKITKADNRKLKSVEESGSEIRKVAKDYTNPYGDPTGAGTDVIVIKKFTQVVVDSGQASNIITSRGYAIEDGQRNVNDGIRLGNMLGKKLQVRAEEKNTKFTRLDSGKIDRRLIASLGFGAERIFTQTSTDKYNPANVHISIDASGSMHGSKWDRTQVAAVAIAKAASMINNINVQISYRSTQNGTPLILIAYDSRTDKITKIRNLFKYIDNGGLTPEGLCFEAIKEMMVESSTNMDSYFINFSDGEPYCAPAGFYYSGAAAVAHTRKRVKDIKNMGIKVLSYFISSGGNYGCDNFKSMYGRDAEEIDVNQLIQLTKTLNKLFLKK